MRNSEAVAGVRDAMREIKQSSRPSVHVDEIKLLNRESSLKAFVTITIRGITIRKSRIIQQAGQEAWLAFPQEEWTGADGKKRYTNLVGVTAELKEAVTQAVLAEWRKRA